MIKKILTTCFGLVFGFCVFGVGLVAIAILVTYPKLPSLDSLQHYQPKMPLTIYSADGEVIGMYGEQRREFTKIGDFPEVLRNAVIAAEDKRFYRHWGVDVWGVARAAVGNVVSGSVQSGASTITQQVAKNFYLSSEKTFTRKFNEVLLAYKIEQSLSKDKILELYFNQIYLGQRAYGFASAAQIYFNKNVRDLTLAEAAMLAGLPKAPSAYNPIVNPERAKLRQKYILNNMLEEKMITVQQRDQALNEELHYERFVRKIDQSALYVAEMVRQELYEKYGEDAYTQGFKVYTTVRADHQKVATEALRKALRNFDRGSSYRGAENYIDLSKSEDVEETVSQYLSGLYTVDKMVPAVVLDVTKRKMSSYSCPAAGGLRLIGAPWALRPARSIMKKWGRTVSAGARSSVSKTTAGVGRWFKSRCCRGLWFRWMQKPELCARWSAVMIFTAKHSIVPFRQCGSRVRPLSRLSIRRHYLRG